MNSRKSARIVGILFITAMVSGGLRFFLLDPILDAPDYLVNVSANENLVIIGTFSFFILACALSGIAIAIYPILKKYNEALALGYVAARIVESVLFIISIIAILTLFPLSQEFVKAGAPDASYFQSLGDTLLAVRYYAYNVLWPITLSLGALVFYFISIKTYSSMVIYLGFYCSPFVPDILVIPVRLGALGLFSSSFSIE